jgi:uncharacterized membrane protein HdeD (DUF308 family)
VSGLLLAVALLGWPEPGLELVSRLIGIYALVVGVGALAVARSRSGLVDLGLALVVFVWPGASAIALLWPAAVTLWALVGGILEFFVARRFASPAAQLLRASAVVTVVFGIALMVVALPGTQPLVWLVAGFAAGIGALQVGAAASLWRPSAPQDQPAG